MAPNSAAAASCPIHTRAGRTPTHSGWCEGTRKSTWAMPFAVKLASAHPSHPTPACRSGAVLLRRSMPSMTTETAAAASPTHCNARAVSCQNTREKRKGTAIDDWQIVQLEAPGPSRMDRARSSMATWLSAPALPITRKNRQVRSASPITASRPARSAVDSSRPRTDSAAPRGARPTPARAACLYSSATAAHRSMVTRENNQPSARIPIPACIVLPGITDRVGKSEQVLAGGSFLEEI